MLRTCISQPTSSSSSFTFHTSAALSKISEVRLRSRAIKKANLQHREELEKWARENRPSVILGVRPGEEEKWRESYLAKLLVDESVFKQPPQMTQGRYDIPMPRYRAFGVTGAVEKKLFRDLRDLSAAHRFIGNSHLNYKQASQQPEKEDGAPPAKAPPLADGAPPANSPPPADGASPANVPSSVAGAPPANPPLDYASAQMAEDEKAARFAQAIDLRNSDAGGIAYENRRRIIAGFSTPENPFDTGRTEVQAALLTYRIRQVYAHLNRCKHDVQNKLSLRKLVHQRAKILKYLKRTERARYDDLLKKLALEPGAVEGELVVN